MGKHLQTNAIVCMSLKDNKEFALTHGQITQENGMRDIESQETEERKKNGVHNSAWLLEMQTGAKHNTQ